MAEMWRVLRPGGILHLTTNVGAVAGVTYVSDRRYGEASAATEDGRVFFERRYTEASIDSRLLRLPWEVLERDYVRMRVPQVHSVFAAAAPFNDGIGTADRMKFVEAE